MLANLKLAIAQRGVKQYDLAAALKISASQFSEVIRGRREAEPWLRSRLAELLHADEVWLFSTVTRIPESPAPRTEGELAAAIQGGIGA
ncbi:MAG TPA: hypothetical protein VGS20_05880 [Candidatus Acidoferrales bacterium]|nr:hypothetical protein [Candidatus Acidoferrales bacterium]